MVTSLVAAVLRSTNCKITYYFKLRVHLVGGKKSHIIRLFMIRFNRFSSFVFAYNLYANDIQINSNWPSFMASLRCTHVAYVMIPLFIRIFSFQVHTVRCQPAQKQTRRERNLHFRNDRKIFKIYRFPEYSPSFISASPTDTCISENSPHEVRA